MIISKPNQLRRSRIFIEWYPETNINGIYDLNLSEKKFIFTCYHNKTINTEVLNKDKESKCFVRFSLYFL